MASCSHWWHAPVYFIASAVLAFIAISTALNSPPSKATRPTRPLSNHISLNASRTLRESGFNIMATLLLISPEMFFSSPNTTIFAIKDSSLVNTSIPPWFLKNLLKYHTSPMKLSMEDVFKKPQGSCFPTLVDRKKLAVTKIDAKKRLAEINHVLVSHPDMVLERQIAIHGVLAPFSSLRSKDVYLGWESIQAPICDDNSSLVSDATDPRIVLEWTRIIHLLSSHRFVSFAIGLNSVLDRILADHKNLSSVTIFAPPEFEFVASSSPMLEKIVRLHILPQRATYTDLAALPDKQRLRTLLPDVDLEITNDVNVTQGLAINGVEIAAPEILSSKEFIVHGITQAFKMAKFPNASR
uniref:FAS1 domain-containing protein n=1 Tax=Salix viminalis TaxID=40686 RepID=A0A6N2MAM8_SALVM